jgi:laminin alpha 1/2
LLNDLDSVGDAVLSLNLTGVSPAPYGILENLENTTKYFQVGARDIEMVARNSCH